MEGSNNMTDDLFKAKPAVSLKVSGIRERT